MPEACKPLRGLPTQPSARGRVCAVTGIGICLAMAKDGVSGFAAGFSAEELLTAIAAIPRLSQEGGLFIRRRYPRVVKEEGNPTAMALVRERMEPCPSKWRGLASFPVRACASGSAAPPSTHCGASASSPPPAVRPRPADAAACCTDASCPANVPSSARPARRSTPAAPAW